MPRTLRDMVDPHDLTIYTVSHIAIATNTEFDQKFSDLEKPEKVGRLGLSMTCHSQGPNIQYPPGKLQ